MNQNIFHKGQKIKIRVKDNEDKKCEAKECWIEILELYRHFALCRLKGNRTSISYWDLQRLMKGGIL